MISEDSRLLQGVFFLLWVAGDGGGNFWKLLLSQVTAWEGTHSHQNDYHFQSPGSVSWDPLEYYFTEKEGFVNTNTSSNFSITSIKLQTRMPTVKPFLNIFLSSINREQSKMAYSVFILDCSGAFRTVERIILGRNYVSWWASSYLH